MTSILNLGKITRSRVFTCIILTLIRFYLNNVSVQGTNKCLCKFCNVKKNNIIQLNGYKSSTSSMWFQVQAQYITLAKKKSNDIQAQNSNCKLRYMLAQRHLRVISDNEKLILMFQPLADSHNLIPPIINPNYISVQK